MLLFPAIDIKDGKVVRLFKGDFGTVHQVADDPVAVATEFLDAGAAYLHMVDLDGARDGKRKNSDLVERVCKVGLQVELGGGIRTMEDMKAVFALGVYRVVIGSAAVSHPRLVKAAIEQYGSDRIAVGIDARDGRVKTAGWEQDSGLNACEFAKSMEQLGVHHIIFTDIDTDGMLQGPAFERLAELQAAVGCNITASGGVSCNEDLIKLRDMGLYGAIIGKAYYEGRVDLKKAVEEVSKP